MRRVLVLSLAALAAFSLSACSMLGRGKDANLKGSRGVPTASVQTGSVQNGAASSRTSLPQQSSIRQGAQSTPSINVPAIIGRPRTVDYKLGPLDLIEVKIFQLPDLDQTARIDQNGTFTMPLIGTVQAGGRTKLELETEIARLYNQSYLQNPRVNVFVKEYGSQRVAVAGAVKEPGMFILQGPTTLIEAVALAKGFNDVASESDVALLRAVNGERIGQFFNTSEIVKGKVPDPVLEGGDIVFVQTSGFRANMKDLLQLAPSLSSLVIP